MTDDQRREADETPQQPDQDSDADENPQQDESAESTAANDAEGEGEPAVESAAEGETDGEPDASDDAATETEGKPDAPDDAATETDGEPDAPDDAATETDGEPDAEEVRPSPRPPRDDDRSGEGKPEQVPGAELTPIALEPERELSAEERARAEAEEEERAEREAKEVAEEEEAPIARGERVELSGDVRVQATGKRKTSVARVVLTPGKGSFEINRRTIEEYFPRDALQNVARQALVTSGYEGTLDVRVRVHGGGINGQAGAVRHGIARALCDVDPELRPELKRRGFLTRDARAKERRKAGLKKARKRPQFSKR